MSFKHNAWASLPCNTSFFGDVRVPNAREAEWTRHYLRGGLPRGLEGFNEAGCEVEARVVSAASFKPHVATRGAAHSPLDVRLYPHVTRKRECWKGARASDEIILGIPSQRGNQMVLRGSPPVRRSSNNNAKRAGGMNLCHNIPMTDYMPPPLGQLAKASPTAGYRRTTGALIHFHQINQTSNLQRSLSNVMASEDVCCSELSICTRSHF